MKSRIPGRDILSCSVEGKKIIAEFEKRNAQRKANAAFRQIFGIRLSADHGKTWKVRALCDECYRKVEPPMRAINEGRAGARNCDYCGAYNLED